MCIYFGSNKNGGIHNSVSKRVYKNFEIRNRLNYGHGDVNSKRILISGLKGTKIITQCMVPDSIKY